VHLDDLLGNGEAQARAALGLGKRAVDLVELLEDPILLIKRYARAGVCHRDGNFLFWASDSVAARTVSTTLSIAYSLMFRVNWPDSILAIFSAITRERPDGLLVLVDTLLYQYKSQIVDFTIRARFPAAFPFREFAELGGLMSYGPNCPTCSAWLRTM
jgi:hypothetical protein